MELAEIEEQDKLNKLTAQLEQGGTIEENPDNDKVESTGKLAELERELQELKEEIKKCIKLKIQQEQ